ncbi:MAG: hypothetical protein L6R41_006277 [Letrouitia leprolyta]|nr:MAG: hypothetical protein L6R41_006277 [Letrouitia leprolyta]
MSKVHDAMLLEKRDVSRILFFFNFDSDFLLHGFLGHCIACIDPIGVNINGQRKMVDTRLKMLSAIAARQCACTGPFVEYDRHWLHFVAEEAVESLGQFALFTFFGGGVEEAGLAFTHGDDIGDDCLY